jgi:DNA-binding transcriptional LysR family regulator
MLLRKGLKISHLRFLAALADSGQISAAAAQVGLTQPAASRLMAELERIAGLPLHQRTGRGVALTPAGAALARRAARALIEVEDAGRELQEIASGGGGQVRIGAVTGPAMDMVLPAVIAARRALPRIDIEVVVATSDVLCAQVLAGRMDFALARLPDDPDLARLRWTMIAPEPVSLVVRRGHPLAGRGDLRPADLLSCDWVMPGGDAILRRTVLARLRALGLPDPPGRLATSSFLLTLALLQQTDAIAPLASAVAARFAAAADAAFAVLPVDLGIVVAPFALLARSGSAPTPAAAMLRDAVLAAGDPQMSPPSG